MPSKPNVYFLYRAGHVNTGSKIMRCDQLCDLAKQYLGERYNFFTRALPRANHIGRQRRLVGELAGDIVIFLKRADKVLDPDILNELRKSVRGMAIDYVDGTMFPLPQTPMDVHISASIAGKHALDVLLSGPFDAPMNDKTTAHVVLHHADPRILPNQAVNQELKMCYFGDPKNAYLPDIARRQMSYLSDGTGLMTDFFLEMRKYNMHYCVREIEAKNSKLAYKPFTKGFNAAACQSNVIVNRQVPDAVSFLGDDYPFLIDSASEGSLAAGFEFASTAYGGPIWLDASDRMRHMRTKITPHEISRQLDVALEVML